MKLKNVGALCKKAKSIILFEEEDGSQWAGEGGALFILPENLGRMTPATLCTIFDIPVDKAAEIYTETGSFPGGYDSADDTEEDELIFDTYRRVILDGRDMVPLREPGGKVYFIQTKYLKAVDDSENLRMTLRYSDDGKPYIAVKDGMFLTAIIMPVRFLTGSADWFGQIYNGAVKARMEIAQ